MNTRPDNWSRSSNLDLSFWYGFLVRTEITSLILCRYRFLLKVISTFFFGGKLRSLVNISVFGPFDLVLVFRYFFLEFLKLLYQIIIWCRFATRAEAIPNNFFTAKNTFLVAIVLQLVRCYFGIMTSILASFLFIYGGRCYHRWVFLCKRTVCSCCKTVANVTTWLLLLGAVTKILLLNLNFFK